MAKNGKQPDTELPLSELDSVLNIARACDAAAVELSTNSKLLYDKIAQLKSGNGNRGPSGAIVMSQLERVAARYFSGSPVKMRRTAHPSATTFRAAVSAWIPGLSRPVPIQPTTPARAA
jgi:hypothetical protein